MATAKGEDYPHAVLTDDIVLDIRSAVTQRERLRKFLSTELTNEALANKYGVTPRQIQRVIAKQNWRHI